MSSIPAKDWKSVWELLTSGIRDYVRKNGFTDVVLGLSGGMDSALVAALAVDALGKDHVHGVMTVSYTHLDVYKRQALALRNTMPV